MSPDEEGTGNDEIRAIGPEEQDTAYVDGVAQAMKKVADEDRGRFDKELKALERVNAKHAKRAEKAAAKAGLDQGEIKKDFDALRGLDQDQLEQRLAELTKKYRPLRGKVLAEAGIDPDSLAQEVLGAVKVPEHAKAVGRRRKEAATAEDNLGWTAEVKES